MLKHKVYFSISFFLCISSNCTHDLYSKFHQNDYKVEFQRTELYSYDKSVFNIMEIVTYKYNRTMPVVNLTVNAKMNISTELELMVQAYKFLSNEYRILPAVRFQLNVCKVVNANIAGLEIIFKCGNVTSCRLVKDTTYKVCNIYPDESQFPPLVPHGEYKIQAEGIIDDDVVVTIAAFVKIYRPVAIPGKL